MIRIRICCNINEAETDGNEIEFKSFCSKFVLQRSAFCRIFSTENIMDRSILVWKNNVNVFRLDCGFLIVQPK